MADVKVNVQTGGTIYIRWQKDTPRLVTSFEVTAKGLSLCVRCGEAFEVGDTMHLFALGPENATEARDHDAGRWYTAVAVPYHNGCLSVALAADHG